MGEEYIEREAVLEILRGKGAAWDAYSQVVALPAADVRPVVQGKWIPNYEHYDDHPEFGEVQYGYVCSACGRWEYEIQPFCNCGAKMDGGEE